MIHKFSIDGKYFLLDVESGAIHAIDSLTYKVLDYYPELPKDEVLKKFPDDAEEVSEIIDELEVLRKEGSLFAEADFSDYSAKVMAGKNVVKALCLHAAHDCNFKCRYCFASEGEYKGERSLMSLEVGKKALDFILENSGSRVNLEVDFFGGEPMMNFDVVKQLVEYGRQREKEYGKNFRFTLTTNALLLNDNNMDYINEVMDNVVLSLDGRPEVNDRMRPTANGKGSYDIILPKIKKMSEKRGDKDHYIRGTYTRYNLDFAQDVLHMADLGFKNVSVEPVVAESTADYAIREEDLPVLFQQYEYLAKEMIKRNKEGRGFNFFHFNIDFTGGPCVIKRLRGCGAGTEYLAVTPEGDLYPCHQFVGEEDFKMGTVYEGVTNMEKLEEFRKVNVYAKEECSKCWARYYCSGGCAANAYKYGGSILSPYSVGCELLKKRVECAIMIKAESMN
ncbi:MAG: thioether cross-link-forming SCIFF peptide maturase [Firmicutes bacterium]|nr:thioether cross-link-forming SCIFF peptide maturase [Bacillota bacterium]